MNLRTSDIVTSDAGRRKLILVGSDVVGLFPAMKEVNTGRAVGKQVQKSPLAVKGVDYKEMVDADTYVGTCLRLKMYYLGEESPGKVGDIQACRVRR